MSNEYSILYVVVMAQIWLTDASVVANTLQRLQIAASLATVGCDNDRCLRLP